MLYSTIIDVHIELVQMNRTVAKDTIDEVVLQVLCCREADQGALMEAVRARVMG